MYPRRLQKQPNRQCSFDRSPYVNWVFGSNLLMYGLIIDSVLGILDSVCKRPDATSPLVVFTQSAPIG